jgi:gluconokinase
MNDRVPLRVVVIGVAGSGKSTVGRALAEQLAATYVEGDDFHSGANVSKMSAGSALTDEDRWDWLHAIRDAAADLDRVVVACSALRRSYRDVLREARHIWFVYLDVTPELTTERIAGRTEHFVGTALVASQFATLERPATDEADTLIVDARQPVSEIVAAIVTAVGGSPKSEEDQRPYRHISP